MPEGFRGAPGILLRQGTRCSRRAHAQLGEGLLGTSQCWDLHAKLGMDVSVGVGNPAAKGLLWTSLTSKSCLQHQLCSNAAPLL